MHVLIRNIAATTVSVVGAFLWTKFIVRLRSHRRLSVNQARKFMHLTTAPLFIATWPLYSYSPLSRFFAACVPFSFALSIILNPETNAMNSAVSCIGAEKQSAIATASYGFSSTALTLFGWRKSPATYIAFAALCFGDGMAAIVGQAIRSPPLPHCKSKTVGGSISCFLATLVASNSILLFTPLPHLPFISLVLPAATATLAETLPVQDNIAVPFVAFVTAILCQYTSKN